MQTACRCYKLEKSFSGARTGFSAIVDLSGESWFSSTAFLRAEQGANGGAAVREPFSPKHEQVIAKKTFRQQLKGKISLVKSQPSPSERSLHVPELCS